MPGFDEFIQTAWNDHTDRPGEVAERLARSLDMVDAARCMAPFARLVTHVYAEHLGRYGDGVELLQSLRRLRAWDGGKEGASAVERGLAVLRHCDAGDAGLSQLAIEDRIAVLATASSTLVARNEPARAIAAYEQALALSSEEVPDHAPAIARALAIGGNNLACALEEQAQRSGLETQAMLLAARAGLKYWKLADSWLEEERAEYRLARSLLAAREHRDAAEHASRCVAICVANNAPAFELFFAHAALAIAQRAAGDEPAFAASRAQALDFHEQLAAEEKTGCRSDLDELQAALSPAQR